MQATLAEVRAAIATAVETAGLRCKPYLSPTVTPVEGQINVAGPEQITFSADGAQQYTASIVVYDQFTDERSAQQRFDELRDPFHARSIKRAVDDNSALLALDGVSFANVGAGGDVEPVTISGVEYLRVVWPVPFVIHQED